MSGSEHLRGVDFLFMTGVEGMGNLNKSLPIIGSILLLWFLPGQAVHAGNACEKAQYVHNYPVHDAGAYAALFGVVEGYVPGPEAERAWPFAETKGRKYRTRDFCPLDPGDRLVRLFEVSPREIEEAEMQRGTLTLVARDLELAREKAATLTAEEPRVSEFRGRRSFHFSDAAGNEFFVWAYPGPP